MIRINAKCLSQIGPDLYSRTSRYAMWVSRMDHTCTLLINCLMLWYDIFFYLLDLLCASLATDHMNVSFYWTQLANSTGTWMQPVCEHISIAESMSPPFLGRQGGVHTVLSCVQFQQADALMIWKMIVSSLNGYHLFTSGIHFPNTGAICSKWCLILVSDHLKIYPNPQSFICPLPYSNRVGFTLIFPCIRYY